MKTLREPLLDARAPHHGFALRDAARLDIARPRQVHGAQVVDAAACAAQPPPEADAVVCATAGAAVGVVTADCLPILLAAPGAVAVAAIHAGWRGLARGVVAAGVTALTGAAGAAPRELVAGIGPHIGPCCYEVDKPVLDALEGRFGAALERARRPARPGHAMLDLAALAQQALVHAGMEAPAVGRAAAACTFCDARRFDSYRRDGARAGRLLHFIRANGPLAERVDT